MSAFGTAQSTTIAVPPVVIASATGQDPRQRSPLPTRRARGRERQPRERGQQRDSDPGKTIDLTPLSLPIGVIKQAHLDLLDPTPTKKWTPCQTSLRAFARNATIAGNRKKPEDNDLLDIAHVTDTLDFGFSDDFEIRQEAIALLQERLRKVPISTLSALASFEPVADAFQKRVIDLRDPTIRLVAPAGSGKTQTMVNRVLSLLKEGVRPERLLLLTFDRAAADALRRALHRSVISLESRADSSVNVGGVSISTLNAFGRNLLVEFSPQDVAEVTSQHQASQLVGMALEELKRRSPDRFNLLPRTLLRTYYLDLYSFLKNQLQNPRAVDAASFADLLVNAPQASILFSAEYDASAISKVVQAVLWLFQAQERLMTQAKWIDFDDQKLRAYTLLRENARALESVQARLHEVIVDEFQDINRLDFELIKMLSSHANLVVTGDDDQAIYGFRGCSPDFIIDLADHLGRPVTNLELSVNYRCPPNLVQHADKLIRHNTRRIPKSPVPARTRQSTITIIPTLSSSIEAKTLASAIQDAMRRNPDLRYDDFCVLYRTNAQSLPIQFEFILRGIPFGVRAEDNVLANDALRSMLGTLRAKVSMEHDGTITPSDQVSTVMAYFRWISARQHVELKQAASRANLLSWDQRRHLFRILPKAASSDFHDAVTRLAGARDLERALDILKSDFKALNGMVGSLEDAIDQRAPLAEVSDMVRDYNGDTARFVSDIEAALQQAQQTNAGRQHDGVSLLTYFRSKGRQWHTVMLCSCNEGLIPHTRAPIEDERRLFYVAMTRASANLMISYVENAMENRVQPSRFLFEAGLLSNRNVSDV